jgi:hypothetical protein
VPVEVHRAGRERLLQALADGPAEVAAPTSWWPWAKGRPAARYALPLAAAAAIALSFAGGYLAGARRAEVLVVAAEQQAARAAAGLAAPVPTPATSPAPAVTRAPLPHRRAPRRSSPDPPSAPRARRGGEVIERVERMESRAACGAARPRISRPSRRRALHGPQRSRRPRLPAQRQRFPARIWRPPPRSSSAPPRGRRERRRGARWYATYSASDPVGRSPARPLALDADRPAQGGHRPRPALAEQYLRAAPRGGYAPQARQLLSKR